MQSPVSLSKNNEWLLLQLDNELQLWHISALTEKPVLQYVIKKKVLIFNHIIF
jgi:hypothetical protein